VKSFWRLDLALGERLCGIYCAAACPRTPFGISPIKPEAALIAKGLLDNRSISYKPNRRNWRVRLQGGGVGGKIVYPF